MPRSVNVVAAKKRRKQILNKAKGFYGARSKLYTVAKNAVEKALYCSYIGRKQKKRNFRKLWIIRINAAVRKFGFNYSKFVNILKNNNIKLNRKTISTILSDEN
ncbi:50S ribosomal protein L20 [Candidatus Karelsulcia muelleri]|uniref:50S ribosomal protein L20 n=1 Tax=Candidatus Karelsulcia muelleri TaxID=336810 RepID=A0A346E0S3_9FLAO|nr:50S ribosomal protein L20 [Candidatus Karelsulcia muelleri]AXN02578.1 LSU ribosomal protein L20p [Candidatus Karelsulcia muelleri]WDI79519.1 50S ribosomal protein L20 [Candidatus Karelsulcia muelleri]WDR78976.1 50S ribosomal protein L20 [Candidatus Karelsulcia muelleri]